MKVIFSSIMALIEATSSAELVGTKSFGGIAGRVLGWALLARISKSSFALKPQIQQICKTEIENNSQQRSA